MEKKGERRTREEWETKIYGNATRKGNEGKLSALTKEGRAERV